MKAARVPPVPGHRPSGASGRTIAPPRAQVSSVRDVRRVLERRAAEPNGPRRLIVENALEAAPRIGLIFRSWKSCHRSTLPLPRCLQAASFSTHLGVGLLPTSASGRWHAGSGAQTSSSDGPSASGRPQASIRGGKDSVLSPPATSLQRRKSHRRKCRSLVPRSSAQ